MQRAWIVRGMTARQANLLAALAVAVADRINANAATEAGRAGQAPAALAILAQQEGLSLEALRGQLDLSQPATVRLVDGLVADRLARRRPGPDGRTLALVLTRSGRTRARRVLAARRQAADEALAVLNPAERTELEASLEAMLAILAPDTTSADVTCRLCDRRACPTSACPVPRR
jgi:DNA-binding MarR family transcriptional regulator